MSTRKKYEEGVSIRAQKRKRALAHYQKKHKVKKPCKVIEELSNETTYYIENGLRKVYPYYFNFRTYVKGRWLGKSVLDVYKAEFKQDGINPEDEIENGNITVNGQKVPLDFVLGDNMMLEHKCHRHEMPVINQQIEVIEDTEELLVINKPASIPVHPCGRYRYNSITMLLKHELGYDNLRILYRLDRLTSGVLILPKTTTVSRKLEKQLEKKELYKEYVCRVEGKFPDGEVVCNEPLGCMSYKLSLYRVEPEGKPSSTMFTRLSYNGKTSVVKCVPHTGRTHQIRVHLQFLGFPICNDPLYNSTAFGPNKGKGGIIENPQTELEAEIMKTSNIGRWKIGDNPGYYEKYGTNRSVCSGTMAGDVISESVPACNAENSDGQGDGRGKTDDVHIKVMTGFENNEVTHEENAAEREHDLDDRITDLTDDNKGITKVCDQLESNCLQQEVNAAQCSKHKENVQDLKNMTEVSDHPCKRAKLDNDSEKGVDVSASCVDKTCLQENCDTQHTGTTDNCVESSHTSPTCDVSQPSVECKDTAYTSANVDEEKRSGKSVLARTVTDPHVIDSKMLVDEFCQDCKYIFEDPKPEELILYLHAVRYKGASWEYSTSLPYWAKDDFDEEKHAGTK